MASQQPPPDPRRSTQNTEGSKAARGRSDHPSSEQPSTHSPHSMQSPQKSYDTSPSVHSLSPVTRAQDAMQRTNSGTTTPTRIPAPGTTASTHRTPRPISLNEASSRVLGAQSQDKRISDTAPKWPVSPRLKSPNSSRRNSSVDASDSDSRSAAQTSQDSSLKSPPLQTSTAGPKLPRNFGSIASTLETVQEGDQASPPNNNSDAKPTPPPLDRQGTQSTLNTISSDGLSVESLQDLTTESEIDTGRSRAMDKQPPPKQATQSQPPPTSAGKKPGSGPLRARPTNENNASNIIVETETVPSIPQSATIAKEPEKSTSGKRDESGSIRAKPSTETIRPKKERKKVVQKKPSVISGASTKADLFEAKVSTNDDSDSDETFVYESNPPEPRARQNRHHSRTPSGRSIQSFVDRCGGRVLSNHVESLRPSGVKAKRSMKFASSSYADRSADDESTDHGTVRANKSKPPSLNVQQQHQHGYSSHWPGDRHGDESPYSAAARARQSLDPSSRNTPRGTPKHSPPPYSSTPIPTKNGSKSPYNKSDPGRYTNEREPLLGGSLRTPRTRPFQRPHSSNLRHIEYYEDPPRSWWARRCSSCLVLILVLLLLVMCAAGVVYATTKPLYQVSLLDIQDVLASEEELILDLNVLAINPNLVPITVSDMDVDVFAKSRHVGTDSYWRHHGAPESTPHRHHIKGRPPFINGPRPQPNSISILGGVDHGTDPIDDPEGDPQTMLLGRIYDLDSPLTFESSPLRRFAHNTTGELRLQKPGNKTETGGSQRWENVIQHPFQLIVRGILKYQLPLNSRPVTASISKAVAVDPDESVPGKSFLRITNFA